LNYQGGIAMERKVAFCEHCRKDVSYTIHSILLDAELKGKKYGYYGNKAACNECSHEIYLEEVNDFNLKVLYDEYRKQNDIISLEKVNEIPKKYHIGKRPLSLILGWGEQTFSRYCDGDIPTQQYSTILQRIYEEPRYFLSLLEENRNNLKSPLAYEKSRDAVQKLISEDSDCMDDKISDVVSYLLFQCEDITPLALQKILYYVQGFYFAFYDDFIFQSNCEAWVHGPVYKEIYEKYKEYKYNPISTENGKTEKPLSEYEKAVIHSVVKNLSCYSGKVLEMFTHAERPWLLTRGDILADAPTSRIVEKDVIGKYFKDVKEKYHMLNPTDIETYSKTMFEQIVL